MPKFHAKRLVLSALFAFSLLAVDAFAQTQVAEREQNSIAQPLALTPHISQTDPLVPSATAPVIAVPAVTEPATPATPAKARATIEETELGTIDPETIGLLSTSSGGLGATLWADTPRALVDRLLPEMNLPTGSATLNDLAHRFLLTTAQVPKGKTSSDRSLTALRAEKLLSLGFASEGWKLSQQTKEDVVDNLTLRLLTEAMLIGEPDKTICDKVPALMAKNASAEWQKILAVCQLRAGDTKAVQLSLDVMREQAVRDDIFISLINRNILLDNKKLPRQLTPLRPINLALLRQINLPLPTELFARPEASLVPQLLQATASDEKARLTLAERSAAKGQISSKTLATVYKSVSLSSDQLASAPSSTEATPLQRAALYQLLEKTTEPQAKISAVLKFMSLIEASALNGTIATALAEKVADIAARSDYNSSALGMTKLFLLAGRPEQAMSWYKLAKSIASSSQAATDDLHPLWPMLALSGLISESDFSQELAAWLDMDLRNEDRVQRQKSGSILLLLSAAGLPISEDAWGRTADTATDIKRITPPSALLFERLRLAGLQNRKGEAVMLAVLLANGGAIETPLFVLSEVIRSLRLTGLVAEARSLARESAATFLAAPLP